MVALTTAGTSSPKTLRPKRGFVADTRNGTCADPRLLSASGWYYDYNVADPYRDQLRCAEGGAQAFVPMHWCLSSLGKPIPSYVDQTFMLGFNEPNNAHNCDTSARTVAEAWARVMRDYPKIRIRIEGHTDSQGSETYNMKLSDDRAASVFRYLVNQGIGSTRMSSIGKGESTPLDTNRTASGRAANRRVEFHIVDGM